MTIETTNNSFRGLIEKAVAIIFVLAILAVPSFAQATTGPCMLGVGNCTQGTTNNNRSQQSNGAERLWTGRLFNQQGQQYATVEAFKANNSYGWYALVWVGNSRVRVVYPHQTQSNGYLYCWYVEYAYNSAEPYNTQYWRETYSGWMAINDKGEGYEMAVKEHVAGGHRIDVRDTWRYFRLTQ
jgi:hypothetical protein